MVVAAHQIEVFGGRARAETCSVRAKGKIVRCALALGHRGHHEARVKVALPRGTIAGYRYAWMD
jgi:hypothetical protein